ncbi:hypothetical protein LAC02_47400 [Ligilactobacillus acidipiscis]|nr:hypothetical protein LAC02_47400 [Ligilactobacillus acidipiscis]
MSEDGYFELIEFKKTDDVKRRRPLIILMLKVPQNFVKPLT